MKKKLTSFIILLFPSSVASYLLRSLGHQVGKNVKFGFSFISCDRLMLSDNSRIGHFNLILSDSIQLGEDAYIGYLNILKGPVNIVLDSRAAIGNKNYITRAALGITYGESTLFLGELTKITTGHHIDLTRSIRFGKFSILAGVRSQIWTHGYYHADNGPERIRIDGNVIIGSNVYVGSGCIFNPGVSVGNAIHIGAGSVISKNLDKQGMYVGQGLRYLNNNLDTIKAKLTEVKQDGLIEKVYSK